MVIMMVVLGLMVYEDGVGIGIGGVGELVEKVGWMVVVDMGCGKGEVFCYGVKGLMWFFMDIGVFMG